jgi:putative chitinase
MTLDQLRAIMPLAGNRAGLFLAPLNDTMIEFHISTPARQASFLSQVAHESGQLRWVRELAVGDAYEGRLDLGNTQPGDGRRYKGRGLLQVTGRDNYKACGFSLGLDLISHPELLELPEYAARSAGWFWDTKNLNALADTGDQVKVTRRINGGTRGLAERLALFDAARKVLW